MGRSELRNRITAIAMCFPTPRDATTDRANKAFDSHVNLSPFNKTQGVDRILAAGCDVIIFADAALDSRVFAMAHERLAPWQGLLWGWGGTLGIPSIDFYLSPVALFATSKCPIVMPKVVGWKSSQEMFNEQVRQCMHP